MLHNIWKILVVNFFACSYLFLVVVHCSSGKTEGPCLWDQVRAVFVRFFTGTGRATKSLFFCQGAGTVCDANLML